MKKSIWQFLLIGFVFLAAGALTPVNLFADVDVYTECAYTESDLAVLIYADINSPTLLRSAGVKLTYDPLELTVDSAEKGPLWLLGSEPYMDPDTSTAGEVIIILGRLDTAAPTEGVSGERVLLGTVRFNRIGSTMSFSPTLGLDYGKRGPAGDFKNFVDTDDPANVLDDVSVTFGSITVCERGDANADGDINALDFGAIRSIFLGGIGYVVCADCNADGNINALDFGCVRSKFFSP